MNAYSKELQPCKEIAQKGKISCIGNSKPAVYGSKLHIKISVNKRNINKVCYYKVIVHILKF